MAKYSRTTRPGRFNHERSQILGTLGTRARRIDHVGSTAVPGLAAKPIVDIDLSVDATDRERYAAAKRQLARRDWSDMNAYADAKTVVIHEITARAERWARTTSWKPGRREWAIQFATPRRQQ